MGVTLIDLSNSGHNTHDIPNAVVVVRDGKIEAAGSAADIKIPKNAKNSITRALTFCLDWLTALPV